MINAALLSHGEDVDMQEGEEEEEEEEESVEAGEDLTGMLTYAHVCSRMLMYADVR